MKPIKTLLVTGLLLVAFFIVSCSEAPVNSTENSAGNLQLSKTANSATLHIYNYFANAQTINIYAVSSDWEECVATWNFQPSHYPGLESSFSTNATGELTADVTDLVNKWLDGSYDNFGLLLSTDGTNLEQFDSREGAFVPYISIEYTDGTSENVLDIADTELNEASPGVNYCNEVVLFTGFISEKHKYALLKFDIEYTPGGGCTLTPGYWQTHSEFGPAPYNDTWAQLPNGASTPFYLSGQTYYEVLWTSPAGNAYYILSFQFIAAELNFLNGADPSAAQTAFNEAETLFETYTPSDIAGLKGNNPLRKQFINLSEILDDYNNGLIGPGHCDD